MIQTSVDYTIFYRELSDLPSSLEALKKSFYNDITTNKDIEKRWFTWFKRWQDLVCTDKGESISLKEREKLSKEMKLVNPKYILREWFLVPAYTQANEGEYDLIQELQDVMNNPYAEQSKEVEDKYYRLKPSQFFDLAGVSFVSCSS